MRKVFSGIIFLLFFLSSIHLEGACGCGGWGGCGCCGHDTYFLELGGGYRRDRLRFSIDGPFSFLPFFGSDMKWKYMNGPQIYGNFRVVNAYNFYFKASGDYGHYNKGKFKNLDFFDFDLDDLEVDIPLVARRSKKPHGEFFDYSGGIGYYFGFVGGRVSVSPLVGYAHAEQHIQMEHFQVKNFFLNPCEWVDNPGLHAKNRFKWNGPWVGVDIVLGMTPCWTLFGGGEYHWNLHYKGLGKSNFENIFLNNYTQHAQGHANLYTLGLAYRINRHWEIHLVGTYQGWHTKNGIHHYKVGGCRFKTELDPVHWHSTSLNLTVQAKY